MENIKFTVRMLAAMMKMPISELAEKAKINPDHLASVSAGRARMTADDLIKLSDLTGIDPKKIEA